MNLPRLALRRPFTVLVAVITVVLCSLIAWRKMPKDILPAMNLPTLYVAQTYGGLDPAQMEGYLVYFYEYHFLYITGIEHVESKSIQGAALLKLQFHPGTDMSQAMAETVAFVNRARAFMPPGTTPPFITRFDAGSAPVGNLVFSSSTRSITEMQDAALNRVRPLLSNLPGVSAPPPFGGNARTIVVSLKPGRLKSYRMSPDEVVKAMAAANVVSPSGNLMIGGKYPMAPANTVARNIAALEGAPVRGGQYPAVFVRDVADIHDDSDIVTCYALVNGKRCVYVPITKRADASALSVAHIVKENLAKFQAVLPTDMNVSFEGDRAPLITTALLGLPREAAMGAFLTALVCLAFLRNWRGACIVLFNIPIALLTSVLALWLCGQTINLMTLGGLSLAVGILVDEGIVCLENIHAHLARGTEARLAALNATVETTSPRLLAMLCVLIMFTPAFFMTGAVRAMFLPLTLAVGFAMATSYLLSSTLVPVLSVWASGKGDQTWFVPFRERYASALQRFISRSALVVAGYFVLTGSIFYWLSGRLAGEIFPRPESHELQVRLRAPPGTDIDGTEAVSLKALGMIEKAAGAGNVELSLGFLGLHGSTYPINYLYLWNGGTEEGVLHVRLKPGVRRDWAEFTDNLRERFAREIPEASFSFEPADLLSQVMNLSAALPIEVVVSGPNIANDRAFAQRVKEKLETIPSLRDVQFTHSFDYPTVEVVVDRERSGIIGPDMTHVSRALVPATWSSRFQMPNFWADAESGIAYQVQTQVPQKLMNTLEDLGDLSVLELNQKSILLRNLARISEGTAMSQYDRYNMQRTITVRANVSGEALSSAATQVAQALADLGTPPPRVSVALRGQIKPFREMQGELQRGLEVAVAAIFLLLLANFQSLRLCFVVLAAAPAVLAGAALTLWLTGTTLNIQSFIGLIMGLGVAVANAILLVTFAERARIAGAHAIDAALEGARTRLRPILMTSAAMIAGMTPIALGLSDPSGQMVPLARAIIGGLFAATLTTLFVLPPFFVLLQKGAHRRGVSLEESE